MKLIHAIIIEIFLVVNTFSPLGLDNSDIFRRVKSPGTLTEATASQEVKTRLENILKLSSTIRFDDSKIEFQGFGDELTMKNEGEDGISIASPDGNFSSKVFTDSQTGVTTMEIWMRDPMGEEINIAAVFNSDGSGSVRFVKGGKSYYTQISAGDGDEMLMGSKVPIVDLVPDKTKDESVFVHFDDGNWAPERQLVPYLARVEGAIQKLLITDGNGNVVTDPVGQTVPVYGAYAPELPVGNPDEGPVSRLQSIEGDLFQLIRYGEWWIYEGDPHNVNLGGKEAVLARRWYDATQYGVLPYPTDPQYQEATDELCDILKSALPDLTSEQISQRVGMLPYQLRMSLAEQHTQLMGIVLNNPYVKNKDTKAIDASIAGNVLALGPIAVAGTILHGMNTSHDNWEGFLVRSLQLLGAIIADTRMATAPDFMKQAIRFLWGDDTITVLKRDAQLQQAYNLNAVLSTSDFSPETITKIYNLAAEQGLTPDVVQQIVESVKSKINPNNPSIVSQPTTPGGVAGMSGPYDFSRADVQFSSMIALFLAASKLFPMAWGLQSTIPSLAVGSVVVVGIYGLFSKVIVPYVHKIKEGGSHLDALKQAEIGIATLPADWITFLPNAILFPYMLGKLKLHWFNKWLNYDKTGWPKPMDPALEGGLTALKTMFTGKTSSERIKAFGRVMDKFMANVVVPGIGGLYAYTLYHLMGPAWMFMGLPQILGWGLYPIALNTFLNKKLQAK